MAALKERINTEMKAALLSGNRFVGDLLRDMKAAILNEEVAKNKRDEGLSDEEVEQVLAREVKKRRESAVLYRDNDRPELAEKEENELAVIEQFLPKQLSEEEIQAKVDAKLAEMGEVSPQDMGKVIGALKSELGTRADGAMLARIVKTSIIKQ